jgi:hypothetical protein
MQRTVVKKMHPINVKRAGQFIACLALQKMMPQQLSFYPGKSI